MSETVVSLVRVSPVPSDSGRSESPAGQRAGSDGQSIEIIEEAEYEERFRVDRRKLEQMLQSSGKGCSEAEDFFLEIMEVTNTHITWPSKLKIGAKSKKDPHIKVSGDPDHVKQARDKIMAVLDTKSNRVTLKMDVSHTEHSHVIGKGGNNIKKVMEETGCHIHFPDSNRNNQSDKSNQVSIAGKPYGVESARMKIRDLLPITLTFEIPVATALPPEQTSPIIIRLQQQYGVTVTFKPRTHGFQSSTVVIIRGAVNNSNNIKEASLLIMENLMGARVPNMPVSLQLDVAAQHHLFMVGRSGANLQQIMNKTGAQILFPEGNPFTGQKKGTILIQGAIDNVLLAREHVIGCLPLVLMFDMGSELNCSQDLLNALMQRLDLYISVKPKPKQPSKSVILKSIEDNFSNMYEARRILLRLDAEEMPPHRNIGQITPHITPQGLLMAHNLLNLNQTKQLILLNQHVIPQLSPAAQIIPVTAVSPLPSPRANNTAARTNNTCNNNSNTAAWSHVHNIHGLIPASVTQSVSHTRRSESPKSADYRDVNQNSRMFSTSPATPQTSNYNTVNVSSHMNGQLNNINGSQLNNIIHNNSPSTAHQSTRPNLPTSDLDVLTRALKQDLNLKTSGAHLMDFKSANQTKLQNSGSGTDLRQLQRQVPRSPPSATRRSFSLSMSLSSSKGSLMDMIGEDMNNSARLSESLRAPSRDKLLTNEFRSSDRLLTTSNDRLLGSSNERLMGSNPHLLSPMSVRKDHLMASTNGVIKPPPGLTAPSQGIVNPANLEAALADYERKKVLANRAIEQEPSGEARNPTDFWSGLGFSRSMPDSVIRERLKTNNVRYDGSNMATTYEQSDEEPTEMWKDSTGLSVDSNLYILSSALSEHSLNNMGGLDVYGGYDQVNTPSPLPQSNVISWADKSEQMDMIELLRKYSLDRYIDLFQQQEIDEATFITLTDQDLRELGIETFGARRKMLLAINDLKKQKSAAPKYFSPTPGSNNPFRTTNSSTHQLSSRSFTPHSDVISQSGRW